MIRIVSIVVATLLFSYIVFASFYFKEMRHNPKCHNLEIVVKDSGNDQNIYQKNSVAEVEIQQKPEVLKVLLRTDENVEISVQMEKALSAPVEKGQKVGEVRYIIDKNIIGKYDVLTRSGLKKRTFSCLLRSGVSDSSCGLYTVTADIRVMKSYRNWELKKVMR